MEVPHQGIDISAALIETTTQWRDWIDLAKVLGIEDTKIQEMKTIFLNTFDLSNLSRSILTAWRFKAPQNVTFNTFLSAMELTGLKDFAARVKATYPEYALNSSFDAFGVLQNNVNRTPMRVGPEGKIFYFEDRRIGHGATANVYGGFYEVPQVHAAIKIMDEEFTDIHFNEIEILRQTSNQHIVRYFMTDTREVNNRKTHFIAMELASLTLEDVIEKHYKDCSPDNHFLVLTNVQILCNHASQGLKCLHSKQILHRDIKPSNVLLFHAGMKGNIVAKLGDFGISRKTMSIVEGTDSMGKGTLDWMAPEALENKNQNDGSKFKTTYGVDIFSLGVTIFWSITLGKHPFGGIVLRYANVINNPPDWSLLDITSHLKPVLKHLLNKMLQKDPKLRPSVDQVVSHPIFWVNDRKLEYVRQISNTYIIERAKRHKFKATHQTREAIDLAYMQESGGIFNWKDKLCSVVQTYVASKEQSKYQYDGTSLIDLIKFIRDKYEHSSSWPDSLKNDLVFGTNVPKVTDMYITYFIKRFPDVLVFIYGFLENHP